MELTVKEFGKCFAYVIPGKTREELARHVSGIDYQYFRIENHGETLIEVHREAPTLPIFLQYQAD